MDRAEKIKKGILSFINRELFDEAIELLSKYQCTASNDPDIYNLQSIIYTSQGDLKKAADSLNAGLEKHPEDFDLLYNLAYIHEQQGELFKSFDTYTKAKISTSNESNKKEAIEALDRLQSVIKSSIDSYNEDSTKTTESVPHGLEVTRKSNHVYVDLDKCTDNYAFGYSNTSWNPFVEALKEYIVNPGISYDNSVLRRYYSFFQPGSLQQAIGLKSTVDINPKGGYSFPWSLNFTGHKLNYFFGPYSDQKGRNELNKSISHLKLLQATGYHPEAFNDKYISGYMLKHKEDYRFIICEGHHRVAALAALGYKKIRCNFLQSKQQPGLMELKGINKWPQVINKNYTIDAAKKVFFSFFQNNGSERAVEADLLCKDIGPQKVVELKRLDVDLRHRYNVKFYNAGLLKSTDEQFANEVQQYWQKHYNRSIDPGEHLAFMNLTGNKDPRYIPHGIMRGEIIPLLNHREMGDIGYSDKNIYDKLIPTSSSPQTVIKRVRGKYFDCNNNWIEKHEAYEILLNSKQDLIIKPSTTDNGVGIARFKVQDRHIYYKNKIINMTDVEKGWGGNFLIQERIQQHPVMAKPHPESVNTLRMVTLRWKGEIRNLLSFARFGTNNKVQDNVSAVSCGISDSGEFFDYAIDKDVKTYSHHPTTKYCFSEHAKVPNYKKFEKFVRDLHKDVLHHDYICWDIAVGIHGQPIFIELNFWGTIWLYQMRCHKSLFGDLTEEVLEYARSQRELGGNSK